jgi:hypothetical protein
MSETWDDEESSKASIQVSLLNKKQNKLLKIFCIYSNQQQRHRHV